MRIIWDIHDQDVARVRTLIDSQQDNAFVQQRIQRNCLQTRSTVSRDVFWYRMVCCLLTTQQRSGPDSAVTRFIRAKPFPLSLEVCASHEDVGGFALDILSSFGGIRRHGKISVEIQTNLERLERGLWRCTMGILDDLRSDGTVGMEPKAAHFIAERFKGFGPKQSRNLLQALGLTRFEIPIDTRITKWLNDFGFPVKLSAQALSDRNYYMFVSDGIQRLCAQSGVYPCVLDAAIFTSFDKQAWEPGEVVW